jgi:hypothetical protein
MEWWNVVQNGKDHRAHSGEREKETYGSHEETAARAVGNALVDYRAEGRALQQEQQ